MRLPLCAYCLGIAAATLMQAPQALVPLSLLLAVATMPLLLVSDKRVRGLGFILLSFYLGSGWHGLWAHGQLQRRLPADLAGVDMTVTGVIIGLPEKRDIAWSFPFDIEAADNGFAPRRVMLSYYGRTVPRAGQRWRWRVRLQPPHGFANPGAFDYEAYLMQRGIHGRGYVREQTPPQLLAEGGGSWLRLRQKIRDRLEALAERYPATGIIAALVIGDRNAIGPSQWRLFAATGTNHLFVISGLHIGLIALCAYFLLRQLGRLAPRLGLWLPLQKWAMAGALIAALGYAMLAGFTLPTQRAAVMTLVFIAAMLMNHSVPVSLRYLLALVLVLTLNPLAAVNMGLWFSFLAVAALLLTAPAAAKPVAGWLRLRPQLAVFALLIPPLTFFTGKFSLLAPAVNLIAIPLVGLVIVPLCLLATACLLLSARLAGGLIALADYLIGWTLNALEWVSDLGGGAAIVDGVVTDPWAAVLAAMAVLSFLLPMTRGLKLLVIPLCLPMVFPARSMDGPAMGRIQVHVLDVGQGLSVLVQTQNHALLYDTGARYHDQFDLGQAVVVPVLRRLGIGKLDDIVISHWDNDHSGGLESILANYPATRLIAPVPPRDTPDLAQLDWKFCSASPAWQRDGVQFRFFAVEGLEGAGNNGSCVLKVSAGPFSLLLPGDIERPVEREMALRFGGELNSTVLVAPHHGSNSSSSWPFIKRVNPQLAVYSAGFANSFGHPSPAVRRRYAELGIPALLTSAGGMVSIATGPGGELTVSRYRDRHPRYWHY